MPKLGDLFVKVSAKGAAQANTQIATVDKTAAKAGTTFSGLAKAIGGMIAAFAAYRGVQLFATWLKSTVKASTDAEVQIVKMNAVLRATGHAAGISRVELEDFAREMMLLTGIEDDTIIATQGIMLTFTQIGEETFPTAIKAAADMSVMFGQDLQQSAIQLGTALNDPIRGIGRLRRIGISFTEQQKESIKAFVEQNDIMAAQAVILDEINREFGGVSEAMGTTFQGQVNKVTSIYGELQEALSGTFVESEGMRDVLALVTEKLQDAEEWVLKNADSFEAMAEAMAAALEGAIFLVEHISRNMIPKLIMLIEWSSKAVWAWKELWGAKTRQDIEATNKQIEHNNKLIAIWKKQREADIITWADLGEKIRGLTDTYSGYTEAVEESGEATKKRTEFDREGFEMAQEFAEMETGRAELLDATTMALGKQTEEVGFSWDAWLKYYDGIREQEALIREARLKTATAIISRIQPVFKGFFNALMEGGDAWGRFGDAVVSNIKRIIVQMLALAAVGLTLRALGLGGLIDIAAAASRIWGGGSFQDPTMDLQMQREGRDVARLFSTGFREGMKGAFTGVGMRPQPIALKIFADPSVMVETMAGLPFNQKNKFYKEMTLEVEDRR